MAEGWGWLKATWLVLRYRALARLVSSGLRLGSLGLVGATTIRIGIGLLVWSLASRVIRALVWVVLTLFLTPVVVVCRVP